MIVGMIGKKRSGKDTFAGTLVEERGFQRFAFADPLKDAVLKVNPIVFCAGPKSDDPRAEVVGAAARQPRPRRLQDVVRTLGWEEAKENREVRRLLQEYGVAIREIQEDFWVRATLDRALAVEASGTPVVVTDVRFPNEADEVRERGGVIVRIVRPGQVSNDSHASETALDDYVEDVLIVNDGTLDDLAAKARRLPV